MAVKELLNPERYKRIRAEKAPGNRYKENPAYMRSVIANTFSSDYPRNLSLKLLRDADEGRELELPDIDVPPPAKSVKIIRKESGRQPASNEQVGFEIIDTSIQSDYRPVEKHPTFVRSCNNGNIGKEVSPEKGILAPFVNEIKIFDGIGGAT